MNALRRFLSWMTAITAASNDINETVMQVDKASKQFVKTAEMVKKIADDVEEDLKRDDEKVINNKF